MGESHLIMQYIDRCVIYLIIYLNVLLSSSRTGPQSNIRGSYSEQKGQTGLYLGCRTKKQLIMISVAVGLILLIIIIIVTAVMLTKKSGTLIKIFAIYDSIKCLIDFALFVRMKHQTYGVSKHMLMLSIPARTMQGTERRSQLAC